MHMIYRSKKQNLPIVNDPKLAPYMTPLSHHHSPPALTHKKSIEIILDKHIAPFAPNSQTLVCYKPQRKTMYKNNRQKKADSGYLKVMGKADHSQHRGIMSRNKSTQIVERNESIRRRGQSQYAPYMLNQRKSGSSNKLKTPVVEEPEDKDWICIRLIQRQLYSVDESSDFS